MRTRTLLAAFCGLFMIFYGLHAESSQSQIFKDSSQFLVYPDELPPIETWDFVERKCDDFFCYSYYLDPAGVDHSEVLYGVIVSLDFSLDITTKFLAPREKTGKNIKHYNLVVMRAWGVPKKGKGYKIGMGDRAIFAGEAWKLVPKNWIVELGLHRSRSASLTTHYVFRHEDLKGVVNEKYEVYQEGIFTLNAVSVKLMYEDQILWERYMYLREPRPVIRSRSSPPSGK